MSETQYSGPSWLQELQEQVGEWSAENFGPEQPPKYPCIGAGEEIGELTTSVLKRAQGIDDSPKYADRVGREAERDAIGDIVIYLLDAAYRSGDDELSVADGFARVSSSEFGYDHIDDDVDMVRAIYTEYGELSRKRLDTDSREDTLEMLQMDLGSVVQALTRFCEIRDYDFEQCVRDAWEDVSGREWNATIAHDG